MSFIYLEKVDIVKRKALRPVVKMYDVDGKPLNRIKSMYV